MNGFFDYGVWVFKLMYVILGTGNDVDPKCMGYFSVLTSLSSRQS